MLSMGIGWCVLSYIVVAHLLPQGLGLWAMLPFMLPLLVVPRLVNQVARFIWPMHRTFRIDEASIIIGKSKFSRDQLDSLRLRKRRRGATSLWIHVLEIPQAKLGFEFELLTLDGLNDDDATAITTRL